jgi:hypothetical protein
MEYENDSKVLKKRVRDAKEVLENKKMKNLKAEFFDTVYGKLYHKQSVRLLNLWAERVPDLEFTEKLEAFVVDRFPAG